MAVAENYDWGVIELALGPGLVEELAPHLQTQYL